MHAAIGQDIDKAINIDYEQKGAKHRALGDTRENW